MDTPANTSTLKKNKEKRKICSLYLKCKSFICSKYFLSSFTSVCYSVSTGRFETHFCSLILFWGKMFSNKIREKSNKLLLKASKVMLGFFFLLNLKMTGWSIATRCLFCSTRGSQYVLKNCNPSGYGGWQLIAQHLGGWEKNWHEFEASKGCIAGYRPVWAAERESITSKQTNENK